jgi:hypothetical protein
MRSLILLPILSGSALVLLAGSNREETPVSPNEKTAAPARLPGEDPKAPPNRAVPTGVKK